jgi:hypothetical protein
VPANALHRRGINLAEIDQSAYRNDLLANERNRIPQYNRQQDQQIQAQDLAIKGSQATLSEQQKQNAAGVLARNFTLAAQSPRPRDAARALVVSAEFQSAGQLLGLPVQQFTVTDQDTDDVLRQQMQAWADALSGTTQQQRVQSTFVGKDGNQWIVTSDGRTVNTGVPVSQFAQRPVETGAGIESFDPGRGATSGPISSAATAPALDQAAQDRKFAENLGAGRGQAQADFEAGSRQRNERARQQVTNIDNVLSALDAAEGKLDWNTTGFVGNALKNVAGTPAHDLQQQLMTVQANLGFDRIQQMREASPTGGALGQVAVQELNALQASVAALAQSQSDQALRDNIKKVRTHYQNWRNVIVQAQQGGGMPDFSQMSDEDLMRIINGQ